MMGPSSHRPRSARIHLQHQQLVALGRVVVQRVHRHHCRTRRMAQVSVPECRARHAFNERPMWLTQLRRFMGRTSGKSMSRRFFRHYPPTPVSFQICLGGTICSLTPSRRWSSRCTDVDAPDGRCPIVDIVAPGRRACAALRPSCQSGAFAVMTGDGASASPRTDFVGRTHRPHNALRPVPRLHGGGAPRNCSTHNSSDTIYRERLGGTRRTSVGGRGLRSIGRRCAARNRALSTVWTWRLTEE